MSSNELCKACSLLEGLERGMPQAAIVSTGVVTACTVLQTDNIVLADGSSTQEDGAGRGASRELAYDTVLPEAQRCSCATYELGSIMTFCVLRAGCLYEAKHRAQKAQVYN